MAGLRKKQRVQLILVAAVLVLTFPWLATFLPGALI